MREDKLCGDIHSIITVHGSLYHHNKVVKACYSRLLDNNLFGWNQTDVPKSEWKLLTYAILDQTMGMNLRWRLPENNSADVSRVHLDRRISRQLAKVTLFLNGDCRQKKIVHYEKGCGICRNIEDARANTATAIVEGGLIPGQRQENCRKDRLGSVHAAQ